ncbi:glycosyltransferase 87 family protein [Candidatus Uabimicrobium sp. HlEnr_7]|uniref:glycosyltransferase 87 family protein n=1 Tax=Candidatus Uabimicrobium helgolandensis TaxID=3095367 RepID=UPI003556F1D3
MFAIIITFVGHILIVGSALLYTSGSIFITSTEQTLLWYIVGSIVSFAGLTWCYFRKIKYKNAWWLCCVCSFAYIFMPPNLSDDIYRYMWDGKVCASGLSPYESKPQDLKIDAVLYPLLNSPKYYSIYPPFSQIMFWVPAKLSQDNNYVLFYIYKLLCFVFFITMIFWIDKLLCFDAGYLRALILVGCNPVILSELIGQGHTEIFMIATLVGCFYFFESRPKWSMFCLSLAALTKLYPVVLFPFLVFHKKYIKHLWIPITTCLLLCSVFYTDMMFHNMRQSLELYTQKFSFNSALLVIWEKGLYFAGVNLNYKWALKACWGIFTVSYLCTLVLYIRQKCPVNKKLFINITYLVLFLYVVCSPTVHPWYIVPLLVVAAICEKKTYLLFGWSLLIIPTYLFYLSENLLWRNIYVFIEYPVVIAAFFPWFLDNTMKFLAYRKFGICKDFIYGESVLDNGCAEGYLGQHIHEKLKIKVQNLDVLPLNKSTIPYTMYDGKKIPLADNSVDTVICALMLHHCEDPELVLREVIRVAKKRIIILESTFENKFDLNILNFFDRCANFVRSRGKMGKEELHFKTVDQWQKIFLDKKVSINKVFWANRFIHKHVVFILDKE